MTMTLSIHGMRVPVAKLGRAFAEFVRDTENERLFNHSRSSTKVAS
jgi:hypothetical protein